MLPQPRNMFPKVPFSSDNPSRLVWVKLFEPEEYNGKMQYTVTQVIPFTNPKLQLLKDTLKKVASDAFPGISTGLTWPIKDGNAANAARAAAGKREYDFFRDHMVLKATTRVVDYRPPPALVLKQAGETKWFEGEARAEAKRFFYDGVEGGLYVTFQAWKSPAGQGVTCYLERVCSINMGDKLELGRSNDDVFAGVNDSLSEYVGHVSAESPTAGMANPW
jgi:hypothetical protein